MLLKGEFNAYTYGIKIISVNTVVVGTGAAGYNAADSLYDQGDTQVAIVTESRNAGTSRNTGSDKQTYYKLSLAGDQKDSVHDMAKVLFSGGCMDGEHALCEAALSAQSFFKLVQLGVEFPRNRYGEYVGYQTDHDASTRATSVGPYTSKRMTECLEASVNRKNIPVYDNLQAIRILVNDGKVNGLLCLNLKPSDVNAIEYVVFNCHNIIYATGGPAGMYKNSVYPFGHLGASGIAFEAGVKGKNLTEWQFGMASISPRWNVSGTYMQVLPRFVSTNQDGTDEHEFLNAFFEARGDMLSKVFLKGYQWPFDVRKIEFGSSIIDILVYIESAIKGRRVFLDFTKNPNNQEIDYKSLSKEAFDYLDQAKACFGTPIDRLAIMNEPAIEFYKDRGVNLYEEMLEIALCAQHNNGGLAIDAWWQTNIEGFFAVGEVSGTHGIYRPGGSALNSGQVGALRAATFISAKEKKSLKCESDFYHQVKTQVDECIKMGMMSLCKSDSNINNIWQEVTSDMSKFGGAIRNENAIIMQLDKIKTLIQSYNDVVKINQIMDLKKVYRLYDILISQCVYQNATLDYLTQKGKSRGSTLYYDEEGNLPFESLDEIFRFTLANEESSLLIQEIAYKDGLTNCSWRNINTIPEVDGFFENVWRDYRTNKNIY